MSAEDGFYQGCLKARSGGFRFVGLQANGNVVTYLFEGEGQLMRLEQEVEGGAVRSIATIFPLADFPERQLFRDSGVKVLGNSNLIPREDL